MHHIDMLKMTKKNNTDLQSHFSNCYEISLLKFYEKCFITCENFLLTCFPIFSCAIEYFLVKLIVLYTMHSINSIKSSQFSFVRN